MTPADAFLAAIRAQPGDDTARLAFADWLEEFGGEPERAEFIRVQCALAQWEPCTLQFFTTQVIDEMKAKMSRLERGGSHNEMVAKAHPIAWKRLSAHLDRRDALRRRESELFERPFPTERLAGLLGVEAVWRHTPRTRGEIQTGKPFVVYDRGFVTEVGCDLARWLAHGPALVAGHPVERVEILDREPVVATVRDGGGYHWLRGGENARHAAGIPEEIMDCGLWDERGRPRQFASRSLAFDGLSAGCLAWAKTPKTVATV